MKLRKRIIASLMIIALLIMVVVPASAATTPDLSTKVNVLVKLNIIKDNPVTYSTNTTIKRWEAAMLFVRLLGKEAYVTANAQTLKATEFSDVKPTDIYAPYVGYCAKNGIISSGPNIKFNPNDNITERAFLIMSLRTLEYQSDVDFTSFSVFSKAYTVGLVTEKAYETRENDTPNYLKKDAVNVLYNALTIKSKNTKLMIIENLINNGITTKEKAFELGITKDITETAFTSVTALDGTKVRIVINESFKNIKDTDLEIYETATPANKLTTKIDVQADSVIILTTSNQTANMNYTVNIRNITDSFGNKKDLITTTFLGNKDAEIVSDYFRISKIEPLNQSNINVYYTNPVNANATIPKYYEIYEGNNLFVKGGFDSLNISCLSAGNGININLRNRTFTQGSDYTIKISGDLRSTYGIKLNNGSGESTTFKGLGGGGSISDLSVDKIVALDSKTLEVSFNKELDSFYAKQFLNYGVITDTNETLVVNKVVIAQEAGIKNKVVRLSLLGTIVKGKTYTLTINFLQDSLKQLTISEGKKQFIADFAASLDLAIVSASAIDRSTISFNVNKPLDLALATIPQYYLVYDSLNSMSTVPAKVTYKSAGSTNTIKLYLPPEKIMNSTSMYRVRISKDIQFIGTTTGAYAEFSFSGNNSPAVKTEVESATILSQDTILVKFTKEITPEAPNILTSNYSLEYRDAGATASVLPLSLNYVDEKTLVLKFDMIDTSVVYTLKYGNLKDYSSASAQSGDLSNRVAVKIGR